MSEEVTNTSEAGNVSADAKPIDEKTLYLYKVIQEQGRQIEEMKAAISAKQNEKPEDDDDDFNLDLSEDIGKKLPNIDPEDKYENLSKKQIVDVICDVVEDALRKQQEYVKKDISESLQPELKKLSNVEQLAMKLVASMGVNDARSKFNDFDAFREPIGRIIDKYPNMSFEDAYLLAKSKSATKVPPAKMMETEKPVNTTAVPGMSFSDRQDDRRNEINSGSANGVLGFRQAVFSAIDKLIK